MAFCIYSFPIRQCFQLRNIGKSFQFLYCPTNYNKKKQSPNQFDNSLILKRVNELGNYYDGTYSDHLGLAK